MNARRELPDREVLRGALTLLEKGWVQGVAARDGNGFAVSSVDPAACAWCASAAIRVAAGLTPSETSAQVVRLYTKVLKAAQPHGARMACLITTWNDDPRTSRSDVLGAIRRALEGARD